MKPLYAALVVLAGLFIAATPPERPPEATEPNVRYFPRKQDPDDASSEERSRQAAQARQAETDAIRRQQAAENAKAQKRELRCDLADVPRPASLDEFKPAFHFPPQRQYSTGNCWAFATTSFCESEMHRLTGRRIKLSETYTVYFEYVEKGRRFVRERGASRFSSGSEGNAVLRLWPRYGIVPAEAYGGTDAPPGRCDDDPLVAEMKAYLEHLKQHELWDEELAVRALRLILDKHLGRPPEHFTFEGAELTPEQFFTDIVRLNLDDYVCLQSTLTLPWHAYGEYEVPENWWRSADYYNVPLAEFHGIIAQAARQGYTVKLNGDTSEPGLSVAEGVALIPEFDIPRAYLDQAARELRIANQSTEDDHDMHLVGATRMGDGEWFLIKDSSSKAQHGPFKGYMFYRDDYVKLKMLTCIVHQDAVRAVIPDFKPQRAAAAQAPDRR